MQIHVDFYVDDMNEAERVLTGHGVRRAKHQPHRAADRHFPYAAAGKPIAALSRAAPSTSI